MTLATRAAIALCAAALAGMSTVVRAEGPTTAPSAAPTTQPMAAAKDKTAVTASLKSDLDAFRAAFTGPQLLTDSAARAKAAPAVLATMTKVYADFGDLAAVDPAAKDQADSAQSKFTTMMATFGDKDAAARLAAKAASKDPAVAIDGQSQQLLVQWWTNAQDAAAQGKVADQIEVLAKSHTDSVPLTQQLLTMAQMGSASPDLTKRVQGLVTGVMKNDMADQAKSQISAEQKLAGFADKPMTIAGKTVEGKDFTTADWKGKVILVDFWATWCPPCRAELPRVEKIYAENHDKGLEILGVSNDQTADALTQFVAKDGKMPWPQLFDAGAATSGGWNPITTGFGINGIPTMFLIDKKGVCRTVEARETMEDMIPKLLAEK